MRVVNLNSNEIIPLVGAAGHAGNLALVQAVINQISVGLRLRRAGLLRTALTRIISNAGRLEDLQKAQDAFETACDTGLRNEPLDQSFLTVVTNALPDVGLSGDLQRVQAIFRLVDNASRPRLRNDIFNNAFQNAIFLIINGTEDFSKAQDALQTAVRVRQLPRSPCMYSALLDAAVRITSAALKSCDEEKVDSICRAIAQTSRYREFREALTEGVKAGPYAHNPYSFHFTRVPMRASQPVQASAPGNAL